MRYFYLLLIFTSVNVFSQNGFTTYSCTLTQSAFNFHNISAIEFGAGTDIWIGLNPTIATRTLIKFDGTNWTDYTANINFPIQALKYDGAGNIWAGSRTGGLLKFDGTTFVQYNTTNSGIASNNVLSIEKYGTNFYIGTTAGISVFDGVNFINYNKGNSGLSSDTIYTFEKGAANQIWMGTAKGLNLMNTSNVISAIGVNDKVYDVMIDANGDKWLGTDASGLIRYNGINFTNARQISGAIIGAEYPIKIFSIGKSPSGNPVIDADPPFSLTNDHYLIEILIQGGNRTIFNQTNNFFNYNHLFLPLQNNVLYYVSKTRNVNPYTKSFLHKFDFSLYDPLKDFTNITQDKIQYLDINNVKAACNPGADIHGDGTHPMYEVPKGSGKHTTFKSAFWIGGYDSTSTLHIAAETHRLLGGDFQPGPLDIQTMAVDTPTMMNYNKVWKVDKLMVENFKLQYQLGNVQNGSYTIPNEILTWPGNPINMAQPELILAPYFDANSDNHYNPINGDYPYYKNADQLLFWVINDQKQHLETGSISPMGIQVGVTAYAYTCPTINDSNKVLNNTTFYNYHIINKSGSRYDSVMIGFLEDVELGNFQDDYIGCDVQNNFAFVYNGDNYDENDTIQNHTNGYLSNTPYFSLNVLKAGPATMGDGIDNDRDGCIDCTWPLDPITHLPNTNLTPLDELTVPEYNRLSGFLSYNNDANANTGNPTTSGSGIEYYRYISSKWKQNGNPMHYDNLKGVTLTGPTTKYLYPGASDPNGYCIGGSPLNPVPMPAWSEITAWNTMGDRRFLANSGKTTLLANGGLIDFDIALVFTQDSVALANGALYNKVVSDNNKVYNWWKFNNAPSCMDLSGIGLKENKGTVKVLLYPNPANSALTIDAGNENELKEIKVVDILGKEIHHQTINSQNKFILNVENYTSGVYLIQVKCTNGEFFGKFIKH